MGKRRLPFGYEMQQGDIVLCAGESAWVKVIFESYLLGASLKEITEMLKEQDVSYDAGKLWNKNMIARILEDCRYTGQENYQAIITKEQFEAVAEKRMTKCTPAERTAAQKTLRKLYGARVTENIERQVLHLLNHLIRHPELVQTPGRTTQVAAEGKVLQASLDEVLAQQPIDEEQARRLIQQRAIAEYEMIGSVDYETEKIRRLLRAAETTEELNDHLLRKCVARVVMSGIKTVSLQLKNAQIIERSVLA